MAAPPRFQLRFFSDNFGGTDTDGDGIPDQGEFALGSDPTKRDSDGDGLTDDSELAQGLDLLDGRPVATGILGIVRPQGETREVIIAGSLASGDQRTAYLATGSYGLAIVDMSRPQQPILQGQLDLPGDATDVAVDERLGIAVVASNAGGLHFVDVNDPTRPFLIQTVSANASQAEIVDGIAYVSIGGDLRRFDVLMRERLQSLVLGGGTVTGLAREGMTLFTMDANRALRAIDLSSGAMVALGSLAMPVGGGKLFVGSGVAYASSAGSAGSGFATANVTNPNNLTTISGAGPANIAASSLAANGSGLAIGVASIGAVGNLPPIGNVLHVLDVSNPANTSGFVTQYDLPAAPFSVAIGAGIAYVADGSEGLIVVNYQPFDNRGQAPTVNVASAVSDVDPATPGIQVQEGTTIPVRPTIVDDVQVRNVELLVNGQVVRNDVSFPFDLAAFALNIPEGQSTATLTIQVRTTDTGGNATLSSMVELVVVPDITAPAIVAMNPGNGARRGLAFRTIVLDFSEPIDVSTLTHETVQVIGPGGEVEPVDVQFRNDDRQVQFTYAALALGSHEIVIDTLSITDRAGNPLGTETQTSHFSVVDATAVWINPAGGFWDVPANWDTGVVPTNVDDVLIDAPGTPAIEHRSGATEIRSLRSNEPLTLSGGSLRVSQTVQVNSQLVLSAGTLIEAKVLPGAAGSSIAVPDFGSVTLDGVALGGTLSVGYRSTLTIRNGLSLDNGTLTAGRPNSGEGGTIVIFDGSQTVAGTGTLVLNRNNIGYDVGIALNGSVTVGPGITVRGQGGFHGSMLINQGTIIADTSGTSLSVNPNSFVNEGILDARFGGTLRVTMPQGNPGVVAPLTSGTLELNGNYTVDEPVVVNGGALTLNGTWHNVGGVTLSSGALNLGGTFVLADVGTVNRTGGTVNLTGTLNNTDSTPALDATTGSWSFAGGTIKGGTVTSADGATLLVPSGGVLDGVTLGADVSVGMNSILRVRNGLTLAGSTITVAPLNNESNVRTLSFDGPQTLGGTGSVAPWCNNLGFDGRILGNNTLTVGPGITIRGGGTVFANILVNQGALIADTFGATSGRLFQLLRYESRNL